jgi:hypothetical protein
MKSKKRQVKGDFYAPLIAFCLPAKRSVGYFNGNSPPIRAVLLCRRRS